MDAFPAIKFFSPTDASQTFPTPISCFRVEKSVQGFSFREWASWYKLVKLLNEFPF